ncbi:MAG: DUF6788 family protein [Chloroflexota bacterium]
MLYKTEDLGQLSVRQLRGRRRRLARALGDVEVTLQGTLISQGRRCGKEGCRCTRGELHGPYLYLSLARAGGQSRLVYIPASLAEAVQQRVEMTARQEGVLEEISALNLELLARRALD